MSRDYIALAGSREKAYNRCNPTPGKLRRAIVPSHCRYREGECPLEEYEMVDEVWKQHQ